MLKRRSFFAVIMLCAFALAAGEPCAAASGNAWQQACRQLITSGDYRSFLSPGVPEAYGERSEWLIIFNDRDTAWDAFALHDMDGDGTPELIVRTEYGMEQADVFTFSSGRPVWLGTMGGDNFFQDINYYDNFGYRGLFTVMGGPAMTVERYTFESGRFTRQKVARTQPDADGDDTVGVHMDVKDDALYDLLVGTFVRHRDVSRSLVWFVRDDLAKESDWTMFFNTSLN